MTLEELNEHTEHRKTIARALNNHAADLVALAKKAEGLGQENMSRKLKRDARTVTADLVPIFDDQTTMNLDEDRAKREKKPKEQRLLGAGPQLVDEAGS